MAKKVVQVECLPALALPADFELSELEAIRAWSGGRADEDQQRKAFAAVVQKIAAIGSISFHPGDPYSTAMKEGRRFVGSTLLTIATADMTQLRIKYGRGKQDGNG